MKRADLTPHGNHTKRPVIIAVGIILIIVLVAIFIALTGITSSPVTLHILAVNDFHGQIVPGQTLNGSPAGGIPVLGAYLRDAVSRYGKDHIIIALPGDLTGVSPAESELLLDEPAILFLNSLVTGDWKKSSVDNQSSVRMIATLGNHEFDQKVPELLRLLSGGDNNTTISHVLDPYPGALFPVIAANVYQKGTNTLLLEPYRIETVDSVPVAFIGAVTIQTKDTSLPENIEPVTITDETNAINRQVEHLRQQGIHAFVILLHEGGKQSPYDGRTQESGDLSGRVASIVNGLDGDVDVVLSGHTHEFTNQYLPNAGGKPTLVTQAYSYSRAYADITLKIDPASEDIVEKSAAIIPAYADQGPGLQPDRNARELLDAVNTTVEPLINEVIATTTVPLTGDISDNGESHLYDLATDSMRWSMQTEMAVLNTGSLRADIAAGNITSGIAYTVMPFHDQVLSVQLTGSDLKALLNEQWTRTIKPDHILQVSGFSYAFDPDRKPGDQVINITLKGKEIEMNAHYTVATTDYLASGGDGYAAMKKGKIIGYGMHDVDIFIDYLESLPSPLQVPTGGRIIQVKKQG